MLKNRSILILALTGFLIIVSIFLYLLYINGYSFAVRYEQIYHSPSGSPVVFLLPHQDDEMLMAGAIVANIEAKRNVYVIAVTDGGSSTARYVINGRDDNGKPVFSTLDNKYHDPFREGYKPLDKRTFTSLRNKELYTSMLRLGVLPEHILFANPGGINGSDQPTYRDGQLTVPLATQVINYYFKLLGDGNYNTVAAQLGRLNNEHGDHQALRNALLAFSGISKKHFFSEKTGRGTRVYLTKEEQTLKNNALEIYYEWNPAQNEFAIAKYSVGPMLDKWRASPYEYVMTPNEIAASAQ